MDKKEVRKTIEQLVESEYDRLQAQSRLREFQDARTPPLAPNEFESLDTFLDFYGRTQDHEHSLESLNTDYTNATEQYDQAREALSRVLPTNALLHYTYEGDREELKDQQYDIVNVSRRGRGQIKIMPRGPTQA